MLSDGVVYPTIAVKNIDDAKEFYEDVLELEQVDENRGGVMYKCGDSLLFVYPSTFAGTAKNTVAGWEVSDIRETVDWLKGKGVTFETYDFPDATREGEIHIMEGEKAAWFVDPDGNILAISESNR